MIAKDVMAGLELFAGLPDRDLEAIGAFSRELSFTPGSTIFSPEQTSREFYSLLEGSVRLTVFSSPLSAPVTISILKTAGQAFGFSSVIGTGHHNSSAEAITRTRIAAIDGHALLDYLEKNPQTGFAVMTRVGHVINRRLAAMRRLLLETIIDYERQESATAEN
jgi:CRP-like cAMP-binding protein